MIGKKGKDLITIPLPHIDIPHFRYGHKQQGGVGQGEGEVGQRSQPGQVQPGDGHKAGEGEGEHTLEVDVTLDELAKILGEELELPNIEPKGNEKLVTQKIKYTGVNTTGPESLRHFKRTYKQALKRQIATGTYDPDKPIIIPTREDRRYRSWQAAEPARDERGHHLHDGRLRLDGRRAEGDRADRVLLDRYLAATPVQGPRDPLHHPRRGRARGRSRDLLPHPRVGRHDDLARPTSSAARSSTPTTRRRRGTSTRSTSPTATTGARTTPGTASTCSRSELLPPGEPVRLRPGRAPYGSGQFIKDLRERDRRQGERRPLARSPTRTGSTTRSRTSSGRGARCRSRSHRSLLQG